MANEYALKSGFKVFFIILGVIALPIFFMGVPVLWIAFKAYAKTDEHGLEYSWLGTKRIAWSEIAEVNRAPAAGIVGILMNPHSVTTTAGKRLNFPAGTFVGGDQVIAEAKSRAAAK